LGACAHAHKVFPKPTPQYKNLDKFKVQSSIAALARHLYQKLASLSTLNWDVKFRTIYITSQMKMDQIEQITKPKIRKVCVS
jgi:hypothetical protein